jgi:antitoxin (DNA-binding transcriptional repressor) of toxin-antitoxin stability system
MSTISVRDLERDLLAFLRRVEAGESFVIVNGERWLAEVRPVSAPVTQPRPYGLCAGQYSVPEDFDQPLPNEILKQFEGA